ncbi:GtrA family protein [Saccharothrix algeriensis]|uniref:Flippase GtrA n=1 Tax=Saccharothrix algeriensis TaxID=173560 RepID=A0A8T8HZ91_9PSEU|nr:GtrA family protein [Saccharothrix algeriensis]MBM7809201.1 putative flippase GtrA [Saccharothrix algeriensis]QTR03560.1 GtrA family protein [Saccharothrix algeriensis]
MTARLGRIVRFGLVGVLNTAVYYLLYLLLGAVVPYLVAHVAAFALAMVGSYFLNCSFTFRTKPSLRTFLLFPLSNATNFAVTTAGLYALVAWLGVDEGIAPLLASAVAIPFTFIIAQVVLLGRQRPTAPLLKEEERTS